MTEAQFLAGEDPYGCLVMLEPLTWPQAQFLTPILDQGALGFISDFLTGRYQTPDTLQGSMPVRKGHTGMFNAMTVLLSDSVLPRKPEILYDMPLHTEN